MLRKPIAVLLLILTSACSLFSHEAPPEDVDKAAGLFFQRFKGAEYENIYKDSAKGLHSTKSGSEVVDNLTQVAAAGKLLVFARMGTYFQGEGKDRMAVTTYLTNFEKGRGELKLYFADESGEWKLNGFEYKVKGAGG